MNIIEEIKKKMAAVIAHFQEELKGIRTGRANPGMVEGVTVDAYGSQMRIKELASLNVPEQRQLVITPFDANLKGAIAKAIEKANLGFQPIVDGNIVRIKIPPMDEGQRKEMIKLCHRRAEEAKVSIRTVRRDANEHVKTQKSQSAITEDDVVRLKKQIDDFTEKFCKEADDLAAKKEKEISTIA